MEMFSLSASPQRSVAFILWGFIILLPTGALAQSSELEALRSVVKNMEQQMQKALQRIEQLEKEKSATAGKIEQLEKVKSAESTKLGQVEQSVRAVQSAPSALNPAIGLLMDTTVEQRAKAGGNFNFRTAELGLAASVDPFARGYSFIGFKRDGADLEEATIVTTSLPWNLTARGGRLFADFGRFPKYHEDQLPFVNFPLSIERLVGGETKADGSEMHYLFPTPFFLGGILGAYNKIGDENERIDDSKSRSWSRFTYLGRLHTYFDLTDNHSVEIGTSLAYTPSVRLAGDLSGGDRVLTGVDLTYRYQPLASSLYQGFAWGSEFYANSERFPVDDIVAKRERSYGGYTYADLKLNRNWSAGFLFDYAPIVENPSQRTLSYSPYLTWYLSEFHRLRFQYSYLSNNFSADKAERGNQFFLQWTVALGKDTHGFRTR